MKISIITAFPESFSFLQNSIPQRAVGKGLVIVNLVDLKEFGLGTWRKLDEKPFGGGAGMLMRVEPIYRALKSLAVYPNKSEKTRVILLSARGENWTQLKAESYKNAFDHLVLICGHYEGVDHRVIENMIDEEISIGNYILSGGELGAMIITDSILRLLPGVVGDSESVKDETSFDEDSKTLEYPQYTRPELFVTDEGEEWGVPPILLSGHHKNIEEWKDKNRKTEAL